MDFGHTPTRTYRSSRNDGRITCSFVLRKYRRVDKNVSLFDSGVILIVILFLFIFTSFLFLIYFLTSFVVHLSPNNGIFVCAAAHKKTSTSHCESFKRWNNVHELVFGSTWRR
jgi:hypothetical protein